MSYSRCPPPMPIINRLSGCFCSGFFFLPRGRARKLDFYEWFWKFLSHLVGIEKDQKLTTLINFFFLPQRVAIEKRQKLRVELYFYVPQWVEHETSVFMHFFENILFSAPNWRILSVVERTRLQIGADFRLWHQNWCRFRERDFCRGIKIDAILITSSLIPSGRSHLSRCFWKNLQKFCCCAEIRLLPLHLLHVWKPFCDPLTYSQWERHFFK